MGRQPPSVEVYEHGTVPDVGLHGYVCRSLSPPSVYLLLSSDMLSIPARRPPRASMLRSIIVTSLPLMAFPAVYIWYAHSIHSQAEPEAGEGQDQEHHVPTVAGHQCTIRMQRLVVPRYCAVESEDRTGGTGQQAHGEQAPGHQPVDSNFAQ